ncbi:PREDICTED: cell growth regulator with RING finger domain protein 1-like isoform X2 [Priapulus caudatus]|nr:PREDICTED: cell growth regulator with RING finger domain protein 1-like isoform X2 [Priapulus caudatus]
MNGFDRFHNTSPIHHMTEAQPIQVMGIHNPFVLSLQDPENTTWTSGVKLKLSCMEKCHIQAYWGVLVHPFYHQLYSQWQTFEARVESHELFANSSKCSSERVWLDEGQEQCLTFKPPSHATAEWETETSRPRSRYPLVVVVVTVSETAAEELQHQPHKIMAYVAVIHVKDSTYPEQSCVFSQFVKTASGQVCTLQQMYMSNEPSSTATDYDDVGGGTCVVCQQAAVTHTLLPCRHACACHSCFRHLDKCPMCRGNIESYFVIEGVSEARETEDEETSSTLIHRPSLMTRFHQLNDRLTERLGFT